MQTTDFERARIAGLYEPQAVVSALREARERTLRCYSSLDLDTIVFPRIASVNPALWELAHIAWFQERWCTRHDAASGQVVRASILEGADRYFDSAAVPHDTRWSLDMPGAPTLLQYMGDSLDGTCELLLSHAPPPRYFAELSLLHEDMHTEALLMTLQTLGHAMPDGLARDFPAPAGVDQEDVEIAGGEITLGGNDASGRFVFDNEKRERHARVAPFRMARRLVSCGEYAAFVEAGGYRESRWWDEGGQRWKEAGGASMPAHWRKSATGFDVRAFDRWQPLDASAALLHVTLHEARAYCRWAARRLPSEAEWEFAARFHAEAFADLYGVAWQWTASPFEPFEGFAPDPYTDYSQPWFGSHVVLRGGSFATRARLAHAGFRNFYMPHRSDAFVGLRTCAIDGNPVS